MRICWKKIFTTFHASNMVLQQQYRARQYAKYSDFIAYLLVAEKNNELLMKNYQAHLTGTKPIFEANAVSHDRKDNYENEHGRGHNRGRRHSRGRGRGYFRGRGYNKNYYYRPRGGYKNHKKEKNENQHNTQENTCDRCGMSSHFQRQCRTPRYRVDMFPASLKSKEKNIETNYIDNSNPMDVTHLDVLDYFEDKVRKIDHLIGDGNVHHI